MSDSKQEIRDLLKKYALNKCTSVEIARLTTLFQQNEIDETDIDVVHILDSLGDTYNLDKGRAEKIYQEVIRLGDKRKYAVIKRRNRVALISAVAAVFVGLISFILVKNSLNNIERPSLDALIVNEEVLLETGNSQFEITLTDSQEDSISVSGKMVARISNNTIILPQISNLVKNIEFSTLKVPYGKKARMILSDSTKVVLNAGSQLRFPNHFSFKGARKVELIGEAYFEVTKNKEHPFIVETKNLDVQVLGTQFNVSAFQNESKTNVVLVEGLVQIDFQSKEPSAILNPGEMAIHNAKVNKSEIHQVIPEIYTSWMDDKLIFRNIEFDELLTRLERHYNVSIVNDDAELGKEIFNANFGDSNIDEVFEYFNEIHKIDYQISGNKIIIKN